jgi:capsular exopolysaccharide synthesis family protein
MPDGTISDLDLDRMRESIRITVEGDDSFHLAFQGRGRTQVMNVTNDLSERFIRRLANMREHQVNEGAGLLNAELETLRAQLNEQEQKLMVYKEGAVNELPDRLETNLRLFAATQTQRQSIAGLKANDQARLAAVENEMTELEKQGVFEAAPSKERTSEEVKVEELRLHLKQLRSVFTEQYPEVVSTQREIRELEKAIAAAPPKPPILEPSVARMRYVQIKAEKESLERRLTSYGEEERALESEIGRLRQRVESTPQHEIAITGLTRGYEAAKTRYNALLAKQQEAGLASRPERVNKTVAFRIVEPASLPMGPSTTGRSRLLLLGLFLGVGLGLVVAVVAEQTDTTFGSVEEFQAFTNLPVIAVLVTDPHSVASEQCRLLALKIRQQLSRVHSPVLAISSFVGGEGKTVTSINLSLALANTFAGRVLLIDSDLRKPRVHEYLGLNLGKGFSDLLRAPEDDIGKYVWKLRDLYIMPGGSTLSNPVSLLASQSVKEVLERLRLEFDFIVIDTPPLLPIVDTHILAGLVDGVFLVVRARYTRREVLERGLESFQATNLLGAVVNDVDYRRTRYAYAYQYQNEQYKTAGSVEVSP